MKIIEYGTPWQRVKCPYCKSKLEISRSDVHLAKEMDELGCQTTTARVTCGACHEAFRVSVPSQIIRDREEAERFADHDL